MKKNLFKMSAFALMLAMAACSNEEITTTQGGEEALLPGEAIIEIGLTNTSSRVARPVGSSAANNNVDHFKLVILKDYQVAAGVTVSQVDGVDVDGQSNPSPINGAPWSNNSVVGEGASTTDRVTGTKKIKLSGLGDSGDYTIIAYAYNGGTDPYNSSQNEGKSTFTTQTEKSGFDVEELFAGSVTATVINGKFASRPTITMERQVAGMLAYFKNVPAFVGDDKVEKIVVKANREAKGFTFPSADPLNGVWAANDGAVTLLTFTMTSASNYSTVSKDGTYEFNSVGGDGKKYQLADGMDPISTLKCLDNTLFGGRFVLPYQEHVASQTLTIEFLGSGDSILKTLKVTTTTTNIPGDGSIYAYDIRRNNFYSIGKKLATDDTTGGEGEEPDPEDPDKPIDLSATDEVTVEINDAWDVLHDMGIE